MGTDDRIVARGRDVTENHRWLLFPGPSRAEAAAARGLEVCRARTLRANGAADVWEWILFSDGNASKTRGTPRIILYWQTKDRADQAACELPERIRSSGVDYG